MVHCLLSRLLYVPLLRYQYYSESKHLLTGCLFFYFLLWMCFTNFDYIKNAEQIRLICFTRPTDVPITTGVCIYTYIVFRGSIYSHNMSVDQEKGERG